jgi:Transposase C of IS166 homeodomain
MGSDDSLPADLATAHALILAQRQALSVAEARATAAEGEAQYRALLIEKLKYTIKKLQHERYGQSAEHGTLLEQLELELADLEEDAAQAETAAGETITVPAFERRKPARRPLPDHLPRERILYPAAAASSCSGPTFSCDSRMVVPRPASNCNFTAPHSSASSPKRTSVPAPARPLKDCGPPCVPVSVTIKHGAA